MIAYLTPEGRARIRIDEVLAAAGWEVQSYNAVNLGAARGVAVREFVLATPHGRADYLLFVDGEAVGVLEAKKEGETLTGVAWLRLHDEREYSFVDATSFALMRSLGIRDALAFDGDFAAAGFVELRPA